MTWCDMFYYSVQYYLRVDELYTNQQTNTFTREPTVLYINIMHKLYVMLISYIRKL